MEPQQRRFSMWYFVAAFVILLAVQNYIAGVVTETLTYSEFKNLLAAGKITEVTLSDQLITGNMKAEGLEGLLPQQKIDQIKRFGGANQRFAVVRVGDPQLVPELEAKKVAFAGQLQNTWLSTLLSWIVPALVFVGIWMFFMKRMGQASGLVSLGQSKAKVYMEKKTGVTFEDVAGIDEARGELMEIVDFLKQPERYRRLGGKIPKGELLVGAPGTGKTLLAKAVAGEAGVPFFSMSGSAFVEMFVGLGAARVRDLFTQAQQKAPCIIFIDELDALGKARGMNAFGGHDEREQTLNQLLVEMDGFDSQAGVIIMAATNRPEILDPALLRAGRFDRQVLVDRPDVRGRTDILRVHSRKVTLGPDVDLAKIAAMTPGFAGADLANLINEAALLATRRGADAVALADFISAVERIVAGLEKKTRVLSPRERKMVAYHEMGHALVAMSLPGTDPVQKVSVIPRGISALGYTIQRPTEDRFLMDRTEIENRLAVLLGGRAAELLIFGIPSTGAADDLAKATDMARAIVARYGMSRKLGLAAYEAERHGFLPAVPEIAGAARTYSEETAREIDCAVREMLDAALATATTVLTRARRVLEHGATELLANESLGERELEQLKGELVQAQTGAQVTSTAA